MHLTEKNNQQDRVKNKQI